MSNKSPSDYRPISCATYDQYEIAILHHTRLHLTWQEANVIYDQIVMPLNLRTRAGSEYLILRDAAGNTREVRLDRIRRMTPLPADSA